MPPADRPIPRSVWFYRMFTRKIGTAVARLSGADICEAIDELEPSYMALDDGDGMDCRVPEGKSDRLLMQRVRWDDHPRVWTADGEESDLQLADNEALSEVTHVRFCGENIVAIDVNKSGPWPTKLRAYLKEMLPEQFGTFEMVSIPDKTALDRLARIAVVKSMEVQLSEATLAAIPSGERDYLDAIKAASAVGGSQILKLNWKTDRRSDERLNADTLKALTQYLIENRSVEDKAMGLEIVGLNAEGGQERFKLDRDFVMERVEVLRDPPRRINSDDAFVKLGRAYNKARSRFPAQEYLDDDHGAAPEEHA